MELSIGNPTLCPPASGCDGFILDIAQNLLFSWLQDEFVSHTQRKKPKMWEGPRKFVEVLDKYNPSEITCCERQ